MTTTISTAHGPIKAIHIQVPVGVPTADGGLEIPNRVFLGGIPTETTELELEIFFTDFGNVKDVRIVTDRVTGECKGYGFVTFDEDEDISGLLRKKTINMKGKKLRVRKAIRRNTSQFQSSESSSSPEGSPGVSNAPVMSTSAPEPVLIFPQQSHMFSQAPTQVGGYQACSLQGAMPNVSNTGMFAPQYSPQQNYQPMYYYPMVNAHHNQFPVPLNVPVFQQM